MGQPAVSVPVVCVPAHLCICLGQLIDGSICDIVAFDKPDALELGKKSQAHHRLIRQVNATTQVDVADTIALLNQALHSLVCHIHTMTQVYIVQILAQLGNGEDSLICDVPALGEYDIAKTWGSFDNLLNSSVSDPRARREVDYAQVLEGATRRE